MPKTKSRHNGSKDTYDTRLAAAQSLTSGDRVRHKVNGRWGIFLEINLGFALPEVWVQFSSDNECSVPVSCNPLDLELANSEITSAEELPSYSAEWESEPSVTVEQPSTAVEVVEELTESEAKERHRLELKVEKAFYEAGAALRELRDKRLYRSTHKTFEEYCRSRFGFQRRHSYQLIDAAGVVDNLCANGAQNQNPQMGTNGSQILPTSERQVRPLTTLEPDSQREVWQQAVAQAGGKVPSGRIVKGIVERLKEQDTTPPPIPYQVGLVVEIRARCNPTLRKHDGCWGIITHVGSFSCKVHISVRNVNVRCKPDEMDRIDPKYTQDIQAVSARIAALSKLDLDPAVWSILEILSLKTCFTQIQLDLLAFAEERYGIKT